jgi:hypothetical protein
MKKKETNGHKRRLFMATLDVLVNSYFFCIRHWRRSDLVSLGNGRLSKCVDMTIPKAHDFLFYFWFNIYVNGRI